MKKFLVLLLALALCFSLIACDQEDRKNDRNEKNKEKFDKESGKQEEESGEKFERYTIQTDSMYPTFEMGDIIVCEEVEDSSALCVGDIIVYWTIIDGERVKNAQRIVAIYDGGGYLLFETKGDNNPSPDPLTVHENEILGKYIKKLVK